MSDCIEVLFVSDSAGKLQTASCYNPHIGTSLMTYRGGGEASKRCLSVIGNDYLISADASKPMLHVWPLNSQEPSHDLRTIVVGKPSALCVSPDGYYCVAGIDCKIHVWLVSSGALLNVITKHYQSINKIVFTDDSSHFITAGEDGHVLVWKLADVVAKQFGDLFKLSVSGCKPVYSFFSHSLPVTDIFVGHGGLKARLFTVSVDRTCKIYSLSGGTMLVSIVFDNILTSVTVNEIETELFVGTCNGTIQVFNLDPYPSTLEHHVPEETGAKNSFNGHTKAVTCLSTSFDGETLASGSNDEKVYLWNIQSKQLLRSFEMKGPISNLFFYFASSNMFSNKLKPQLVVSRFDKISKLDEKDLEVKILVHEDLTPISFDKESFEVNSKDEEGEEKEEKEGYFSKSSDNEEIVKLKEEISKLKKINKQLYLFAVNRVLKNPLTCDPQKDNANEQEVNLNEDMEE